ncbi:MAG: murein hydrolase activator EnvC family protein [Solirubrobacterales bacterium]
MRASSRGNSWRLLLPAALLLAVLCMAASAPARDLEEKLDDTQGKLSHVRESQSALAATIAEQNHAIDSMIGEVSALRQRQAAVESELSAKQDELDQATAKLAADKHRLTVVRARLHRALGVLRERLVAIYESGSPDMLNVVLDSASWSEVTTRADYLNQVQEYDDSVAARVKGLRDQARAAVKRMTSVRIQIKDARDAIAVKEREAAAASQEAAARFAELKSAQATRQQSLESLESREEALSNNLAAISEQIESTTGVPAQVTDTPAPLTPGEAAEYISESQASVPSAAPAAIAAAIEAANSIATTPYIWGGGHGSFESSGYDCSGAVSFALHGGGFLSSPLDSTGLETWGAPGPGHWITVYANSGHAWMIIAGLAFDTVGGPGPRWHSSPVDSPEGFIARHPPGY